MVEGDEWLEEFQPRVEAAPTRDAAFELIDEMVCQLNDYHTKFVRRGRGDGQSGPDARPEVVLDSRRRRGRAGNGRSSGRRNPRY